MSKKEVKLHEGGYGLFGVLTIVFIVLKLTGNISWSWWLVLLPMYGPIVLALVLLLIASIIYIFKKAK